MTISARFPLVTPPARVQRRDSAGRVVVRQLVDGGYFDNSGIETVLEVLGDIIELRQGRTVEVLVFDVAQTDRPIAVKGTIAAPLNAFASAWRARRDLTAERLDAMVVTPEVEVASASGLKRVKSSFASFAAEELRVCPVTIFEQTMNFTVSWYLTPETFHDIRIQMDDLAQRMSRGACPD